MQALVGYCRTPFGLGRETSLQTLPVFVDDQPAVCGVREGFDEWEAELIGPVNFRQARVSHDSDSRGALEPSPERRFVMRFARPQQTEAFRREGGGWLTDKVFSKTESVRSISSLACSAKPEISQTHLGRSLDNRFR
jgi:hypothetical protein